MLFSLCFAQGERGSHRCGNTTVSSSSPARQGCVLSVVPLVRPQLSAPSSPSTFPWAIPPGGTQALQEPSWPRTKHRPPASPASHDGINAYRLRDAWTLPHVTLVGFNLSMSPQARSVAAEPHMCGLTGLSFCAALQPCCSPPAVT